MRDPAYPVFCGLGAVLALMPLPWHIRARNTGTLIYVGWSFSACIVFLVNSIVWAENVNDVAPVWCDISSRFVVAVSVGIPASSLCIQRQLYRVATTKQVPPLRKQRIKELIIELGIGVGLPLLVAALHYIVEPLRYVIIEDVGCYPSEATMVLSMFVGRMWSVIVSLVACVYTCLILRAFLLARRQFSQALSDSGSDLNLSRFFRLMALALTDMCFSLPFALYFLIFSALYSPFDPWISWDETHKHVHEIGVMSHEDMQSIPGLLTNFAMATEAVEYYRLVFWAVVAPFGLKPGEPRDEEASPTSWPRRISSTRRGAQVDITLTPSASATVDTIVTPPTHIRFSGKNDSQSERHSCDVKAKDLEGQT